MKGKKIKIIAIVLVAIILLIVGSCLFMKYQTYDYIKITQTYENKSKDNANYASCMGGILRYSRDGIALLSKTGKEKWNQPCQLNNPFIAQTDESVAVADRGGTSILVFSEKGLKGEIKTTRPIERVSVSTQGIVSAILKDDETPLVMCYDAKGAVLVEHQVSISKMGYPLDVGISEDGETLVLSYLNTESNHLVGKVAYYYFGEGGTTKENNLVLQQTFENAVLPVATFLNKDISLIVADHAFMLYKGLDAPKQICKVDLQEEIQRVAYNDGEIAILTKNTGASAYKLHIYNMKGKELAAVDVDKEYTQMKVENQQVLLYDGQLCSIYLKNGTHKYEGKMDQKILEIFPLGGLNKYMLIDAKGFHEAQLTK